MRGLNLPQRGLLLVAFPLACQLTFAGVLIVMLAGLQADLSREFKSRELIYFVHGFGREIISSLATFVEAGHLSGRPDVAVGNAERARVLAGLNEVLVTMRDKPEQKENARRLESGTKVLTVQYGVYLRDHDGGKPRGPMIEQVMYAFRDIFLSIGNIIESEVQKGSFGLAASQEMRTNIKMFLVVAQVLSVGAAFLLAYLFAVGISRPLERISTNSHLLSEQKPLLPPLEGRDELSQLDATIHSVAIAVENARRNEIELIDQAADLICSLDADGTFTKVNPFVKRMLGFEPEEVVGKTLIEMVPPLESLTADDSLSAARKSKEMSSFELKMRTRSGDIVDSRWSCFWSELDNNLFCVVQDVTEQKRIDRLKDDFVSMISHDLRSPLMSILSSCSMLSGGARGELTREAQREIGKIDSTLDILISLVNDLLDFQKLKSGKLELEVSDCNLSQVLADSSNLVKELADKKDVTLTIPEGTWSLVCDRNKILQTITNLLSNAIKFTDYGTEVKVEVMTDTDEIEINVADCGPGIPDEYREKIFEAFEQVKSSEKAKEGTGLGLAICKLAIEAHGGSIGVKNKRDEINGAKGCIFWIRIPRNRVQLD